MAKVAKVDVPDSPERAPASPLLRVGLLLIALAILGAIGEDIRRAWSSQSLDLDDGLLLLTYVVALAATLHYFVRRMLPVAYAVAIALVTLARYVAIGLAPETAIDRMPLAAAVFVLLLALVVLYARHRKR